MIKAQEDFFSKIFTSHFIARVRKGLLEVFVWERSGDRIELKYFDSKLMAVSVVSFSFSRAAQLEAQGPLCWVMAFFIASYQHLLWIPNSIGVLEGPFSRVWLSLPHLVSPSDWNSNSSATWLLSWLSYIIVQRPRDLWNRMFNRHQAEINVMQFTGHSLPVHQSMSVSWALPCPISSANFRPRDFLS